MNESRDQKNFYENYAKVLEAIKSYHVTLYYALKISLENQIGIINIMADKLKPPYDTMMEKLKNATKYPFEHLDAKAKDLNAIIDIVLKDLKLK